MNKISLVFIPIAVMFLASLFYSADLNSGTTVYFESENVTVNEETGNVDVEPINITNLLQIIVIVSVALAICLVMAVKVFGSGVSGSVIPIVFLVTIASAVFTLLSSLSYDLFMSIPYFGMPIFFGLTVMFIIGIAGLAGGGGGD